MWAISAMTNTPLNKVFELLVEEMRKHNEIQMIRFEMLESQLRDIKETQKRIIDSLSFL